MYMSYEFIDEKTIKFINVKNQGVAEEELMVAEVMEELVVAEVMEELVVTEVMEELVVTEMMEELMAVEVEEVHTDETEAEELAINY